MLVLFDFGFGDFGLDHNLLAFFRVVPESRRLLHGVEPLQLVAESLQIQRLGQSFQLRPAVVELLPVSVKFNIHILHPFLFTS